MTDIPVEAERGIQPEIEEIISGFGRLSISLAPKPPLRTTFLKIQHEHEVFSYEHK